MRCFGKTEQSTGSKRSFRHTLYRSSLETSFLANVQVHCMILLTRYSAPDFDVWRSAYDKRCGGSLSLFQCVRLFKLSIDKMNETYTHAHTLRWNNVRKGTLPSFPKRKIAMSLGIRITDLEVCKYLTQIRY